MSEPVRVFIGFDARQPLAYNVAQWSVQRNALSRVTVEPLILYRLPIKRMGLTAFTYSRFLVPWLCDYTGVGIFIDPDIVVTGNICELAECADGKSAVQVMQEQPKFEWASVMLFNCARCEMLTPEWIADTSNHPLNLEFADIGRLPEEWNHCVGYAEPKEAKLYHYTQGIPHWIECKGLPEDVFWRREYEDMIRTVDWAEMMGKSIHAPFVIKRMLASRYGIKVA